MKKLQFGIIAVALAMAFSAFTTPNVKKDQDYWVYTSSDNNSFMYAYKYEIETLSGSSAAGCDNNEERPCVLGTVSSIGSDTTSLHNYLAAQGSESSTPSQLDQNIVDVSTTTQSYE